MEEINAYFANSAVCFNSIFAMVSFVSLVVVPIALVVILNKYWYPHVKAVIQWRFIPRVTAEGKVDPLTEYHDYCRNKYQDARILVDEKLERYGALVKSFNVLTGLTKSSISIYILFNFARKLMTAFIIVYL